MGNLKTVPVIYYSNLREIYNNRYVDKKELSNEKKINVEDGCGFGRYAVIDGKLYCINPQNEVVELRDGKTSSSDFSRKMASLIEDVAIADGISDDLTKKDIKVMLERGDKEVEKGIVKVETNNGYYGYDRETKSLEFTYDAYNNNRWKYGKMFTESKPNEIAETMSKQITGFSNNQKTCEMFKAIPTTKIFEVLKSYSENNKHGLIEDMAREFGMEKKDIKECLDYLFESELADNQEYKELIKKLLSGLFSSPKPWEYDNFKAIDDFLINNGKQ